MGRIKSWLDHNMGKFISRKLMVWCFATAFFAGGLLDAESWTGLSLGYIGIEGVADAAAKWRHPR
jgi:hypothetical protein